MIKFKIFDDEMSDKTKRIDDVEKLIRGALKRMETKLIESSTA